MATVPLFKCRHGNVMVCKGKHMFPFNSGRYWTQDPEAIKVLQELAARRGQGIYIDPNEPEIDPTASTPMDVMKRKIIKEYLESQGIVKDAGDYVQPGVAASAMNTASSVVNNNSMADKVHDAKQLGESVVGNGMKPATALDKLKDLAAGKGQEEQKES